MDRERWRRVAALFDEAVERAPSERRAFVERASGGDRELRLEVERLLAADAGPSAAFEERLGALGERVEALARDRTGSGEGSPPAGLDRLGPYRLERVLGEGGMGTVYLARRDDDAYRRRVAVKVIRGDLLGDDALRRFRAERWILAELEHPHIARLYDGGADDAGRPYLVMEYVEGEPITRRCARRGLGVDERLALFRRVVDAVAHAHERGLVHRDLKPGNVLVTEDGTPKLLDFGIAKPLDPSARASWALTLPATTAAGRRPLTPAYASPEQIRGDAVTPAGDVFALGVLLYELLTGVHPFASPDRTEPAVVRAVCEEAPPPPGRVAGTGPRDAGRGRRRVGGDLDTIVLTALRKEPERRYASATELADDLHRHRDQLPIRARPDTLGYRTGKFIRRHRWGVGAAAALAAMAILLGAALVRHASDLDRERRRSAATAEGLVELLAAPEPPSEARGLRPLDDEALERTHFELGGGPDELASLLEILGATYHREGLDAAAAEVLERSLALRRHLETGEAGGPSGRIAGHSQHLLGAVLASLGHPDRAEALLDEALALRRAELGPDHPAVAETLQELAALDDRAFRYDRAEDLLRRSLAIRRNACGTGDPRVADTLDGLASLLARQGRLDEAELLAEEALARRRELAGNEHPIVASSLITLGNLALRRGDPTAAEGRFREALAIRERALPPSELADDLGTAHALNGLARSLAGRRDAAARTEAIAAYRRALGILRRAGPDSAVTTTTVLANLAVALSNAGDLDRAEPLLREVVDLRREQLGTDHPLLGQALYSLGRLLHRRGLPGDLDAAARHYRRADRIVRSALPPADPARLYPGLALGHVLLTLGRSREAHDLLRRLQHEASTGLPAGHWQTAEADSLLGASLVALERYGEAEDLLIDALPALRSGRGPDAPPTVRTVKTLVTLYERWDRPEQAALYRAALDPP